MAWQSALPDADELVRLREEEGKTYQEIADMYGVAKNSVYLKIRRYRADHIKAQMDHSDTVPWNVAAAHEDRYPAKMLRLLSTRNQGGELNWLDAQNLDAWLARLDDEGMVVDYDRTHGWKRVKRKAEDGDGYIRQPPPGHRRRPATPTRGR